MPTLPSARSCSVHNLQSDIRHRIHTRSRRNHPDASIFNEATRGDNNSDETGRCGRTAGRARGAFRGHLRADASGLKPAAFVCRQC